MTKYFLHGGMTGIPCENNDNYYKENMPVYAIKETEFVVVEVGK